MFGYNLEDDFTKMKEIKAKYNVNKKKYEMIYNKSKAQQTDPFLKIMNTFLEEKNKQIEKEEKHLDAIQNDFFANI